MAKSKKIAPWHIKRIFARGRQSRGRFFNLKAFKRETASSGEPLRLVIVISKKVFAKAVDRNFLRRRVASAFKEAGDTVKGYDAVVFPNQMAKDADFAKLKEDARQCLEKLPYSR